MHSISHPWEAYNPFQKDFPYIIKMLGFFFFFFGIYEGSFQLSWKLFM